MDICLYLLGLGILDVYKRPMARAHGPGAAAGAHWTRPGRMEVQASLQNRQVRRNIKPVRRNKMQVRRKMRRVWRTLRGVWRTENMARPVKSMASRLKQGKSVEQRASVLRV